MTLQINSKPNCNCAYCKNRLPFDLPEEVIEEAINGNLVVFAGAGISTENDKIFKETLYEDVLYDLPKKQGKGLDFPSLMSLFCNSHKNGRQKLLQKIKFRLDYCHQFAELYRNASDFHQELSTNYFIKTIVTTNWDDYFERETNAIPITIPEDFAFYNLPDRKVFKIHGSISNYGTVVATKEDYDKCYKNLNRGIIGSTLKTMLATKTILFVGYSFRDYDFLKIYSYLEKELKGLIPHIYIITLDKTMKKNNATIINTDGTFFFSALRKHLEGKKYLFPKENIQNIYLGRSIIGKINVNTSNRIIKEKKANLVYCTFYQDGMKHAFDFLIYHSNSGLSFFPPKIFNSIDSYRELRKEKLKAGNYADIAYIDGYMEGLKIILYDEKHLKDLPFWYLYGFGPVDDEKFFNRAIKKNEIYHKSAESYGRRYFNEVLDPETDILYHHRPFL